MRRGARGKDNEENDALLFPAPSGGLFCSERGYYYNACKARRVLSPPLSLRRKQTLQQPKDDSAPAPNMRLALYGRAAPLSLSVRELAVHASSAEMRALSRATLLPGALCILGHNDQLRERERECVCVCQPFYARGDCTLSARGCRSLALRLARRACAFVRRNARRKKESLWPVLFRRPS